MNGPVTTESLLRHTFSVSRTAWVPFLAIAFLAYSPEILIRLFVLAAAENPMDGLPVSSETLESAVSYLLIVPVASAALIYGVFRRSRGESSTIGECLRFGLGRWFPVVILFLAEGIILYWGKILAQLIDKSDPLAEIFSALALAWLAWAILAIIVDIVLFVAIPALVLEELSIFDVFGRSWHLAKNHKVPIVGVYLVVGSAIRILLVLLGVVVLGAFTEHARAFLSFVLLSIPLPALWHVAAGVTYLDLRVSKEGMSQDELAEVFD